MVLVHADAACLWALGVLHLSIRYRPFVLRSSKLLDESQVLQNQQSQRDISSH